MDIFRVIMSQPVAQLKQFGGQSVLGIIKELKERKIPSSTGKEKWCKRTIDVMLSNEKYKGDILLQKSQTVDLLTKKWLQDEGGSTAVLYEDDHEVIIELWIWECVQLEMKQRERYREEYNITRFS